MAKHLNKNNKEHRGMIFIPDISGFTKFVHDFDIRLGKEIIAELLSTILQTNILGLKVSEIEGDAILFYRYGAVPTLKDLINQYELMLITFKKKLLELTRGQPSMIPDLSLKLIVHYGVITEYKLYGFKKLYGVAVVDAHKLLKNDILSHNYILITEDFLHQLQSQNLNAMILPEWITKKTADADNMSFTYFLYNTEILKETVLQEHKNENL